MYILTPKNPQFHSIVSNQITSYKCSDCAELISILRYMFSPTPQLNNTNRVGITV